MSIDVVFTLPVAEEPSRPRDISPVEWGAAPGPVADAMRLEEIEATLLEAGFDGFSPRTCRTSPPASTSCCRIPTRISR